MQQILVNQNAITETRMLEAKGEPLAPGQARLAIESFAVTSNNVTYAAAGFDIGYWQFFPTSENGWGIVPVWGSAKVVESRTDVLELGTRLYGFYPMASELVITPEKGAAGLVDAAAHRAKLPLIYNQYTPVKLLIRGATRHLKQKSHWRPVRLAGPPFRRVHQPERERR